MKFACNKTSDKAIHVGIFFFVVLCLVKNTRRFGKWFVFHQIKIIYKIYFLGYSDLYPENS